MNVQMDGWMLSPLYFKVKVDRGTGHIAGTQLVSSAGKFVKGVKRFWSPMSVRPLECCTHLSFEPKQPSMQGSVCVVKGSVID